MTHLQVVEQVSEVTLVVSVFGLKPLVEVGPKLCRQLVKLNHPESKGSV